MPIDAPSAAASALAEAVSTVASECDDVGAVFASADAAAAGSITLQLRHELLASSARPMTRLLLSRSRQRF